MRRTILIIASLCMISIEAVCQTQVIKVACIGDSVTYGTGIEDRENDSYPAQLQKMLGEEYIVGNFGKPGATLLNKGHRPYTAQEEFRKAMEFAGDICIIHLGLNDTDPRNWPNYSSEFTTDYMRLIDSLKSVNPDVRILIALTSPITHKHKRFISGTQIWQEKIQEEIRLISECCNVQLLDFHTPLYRHHNYLPDSIHPDAKGAEILAKTVYSAITGDYGGLSMPITYSDHMVIQREKPIRISGNADTGDVVVVSLGNQKVETTVSSSGCWEVVLKPMKAMTGLNLSIETDSQKLEYKNVAIGEVWLCSGQSNMAFMVNEMQDPAALDECEDSDLRFLDMKGRWSTDNKRWSDEAIECVQNLEFYQQSGWSVCSEDSAKKFSAVAYFFGKKLRDSLNVPVGLICNAIGGSTTESWIDRYTLETQMPAILNNWLDNDFIQQWARNRAATNIGAPQTGSIRHPYEPTYLFEAGILPLERYEIKGVIWYQGESNAHNIEVHEQLFRLLVSSWRKHWDNENMPFNFVQLSSTDRASWPEFRNSQRLLSKEIAHTGMAVCSDVGDSLDVHPKAKAPVGERLARIALHDTYGMNIDHSGPEIKTAAIKYGKLILEFSNADGLRTSDGEPLRGFEIAGKDKRFKSADALIKNDKVIISIPDNIEPSYVRYAWQPFTRANLVNDSDLPTSTFLSEIEK